MSTTGWSCIFCTDYFWSCTGESPSCGGSPGSCSSGTSSGYSCDSSSSCWPDGGPPPSC
jgi:hypothetical protein